MSDVSVSELQATIARLEAERDALQIRNEAIADELEALKRRLFGRKTEQEPQSGKSQLFSEDEIAAESAEDSDTAETTVRSHTRRARSRKPLPENLEREEILLDIPEEEKTCACGHELVRIGEETSEKLDVIPARFRVKRYIRPKYACRNCEGSGDEDKPAVRVASMPPAIIERGIATPTLLAFIIINKYVDSMPLARQEAAFARLGVELPRQRMADWVMAVSEAAAPVVAALSVDLRAGPVMLADETTVQVLGEEDRPDTSKSQMWAAYGGLPETPAVLYRYAPSRSTDAARELVGEFSGYLQTDGYEAYDRLARDRDDLIHVGCWAHARRKFFDAKTGSKKTGAAEQAIAMIAKLYQLEKEHSDMPRDETFLEARRSKAEPIFASIKKWLDKKALHVPPSTALGKAVSYTLGQWDKLIRYVESPHLTPDTNRIENKIRPFVIGRKNWLFSGSPRGAQATAGLYSLLSTAKANGIDPYRYMRTLIGRLPTDSCEEHYRNLLPYNIELD